MSWLLWSLSFSREGNWSPESSVILPEAAELDVAESQRAQAVCFHVVLLISLQPALEAPLASMGML